MTRKPSDLIHKWSVTPDEARRIQRCLATEISLEDDYATIQYVAGVDVGFEAKGRITRAAIVVLDLVSGAQCEAVLVRRQTQFPYIPGLLSFRELPAILEAFELLSATPDMVFCDGQGVAHPRGLGIAAHLGLLTDLPCIGVGKSRLIGTHEEVPDERGALTPLWWSGQQVGTVLRSRVGVKPLYISPGHRVSHDSAPRLVMQSTGRFRLPEPIRAAHRLASAPAIRRAAARGERDMA